MYSRVKGVKFGSTYKGMPYLMKGLNKPQGEWAWSKSSYDWELAELYYRIDAPEEVLNDLIAWDTK